MIYQDLRGDENLEKALEYQIKALEIREKGLDKNHPDLAASYNNLSSIYRNLRGDENLEKALVYLDKAISILKVAFPEGHKYLEVSEENKRILIDEMNK